MLNQDQSLTVSLLPKSVHKLSFWIREGLTDQWN